MVFKKCVRRLISFLLALLLTTSMAAIPTKAAENDPQSLRELFNADFYAAKYPEVANNVGNNPDALYRHFVEYGINEGRTCSALLNAKAYRDSYSDIDATYSNDWDGIVKHYFEQGIKENRNSFVPQGDLDLQRKISKGNYVTVNSKNGSIFESVQAALEVAQSSDSGYAVDSSTGIIADNGGHALIPWSVIEEEGRISDIDELIDRCGKDLILVRDENNQIKFVGGKFSNVKVTDETSALKALDTMANLYGNVENRSYLKLNNTGTDSMGNPFYRFVPVDKEVGFTQDRYTVTLSTDKDGNVLGASNSLVSSLYGSGQFVNMVDDWGDNLQSVLDDPENGYKKIFEEPKLVYDPESKNYYWAMYYEKDGVVNEYLIDVDDGQFLNMVKYYDAETFNNNREQSFNRDYEFKNLNKATEKTFIDFFNNPVKLPVAYEEGKGWYIVDPERHIIGVESPGLKERSISKSQLYDKHYFTEEYFDAVNAFLNGEESADLVEDEKILIQSFTTIQSSFDEYNKMGMLSDPKTIYVNYKREDTSDNASQVTLADMIVFTINNNAGNADFAGISHEFGHAVVANQGQSVPYQAATGAINESYADILGNLMKMIKKQEGTYAGNVDFQRWLIGDFLGSNTNYVIRDMSNPNNNGNGGTGLAPSPIQINDQYFVQDEGVYNEDNDLGGVHDNNSILSHISYRMYNEVIADKGEDGLGTPDMNKYRDLLQIWYDSVIYINNNTTYSDIKGYVLQSMKNHGYTSDQIKQTESIFDDANVDDYKPFNSGKAISEVYDKDDMAVAAKVGSKMAGQNELYNYMGAANDLSKAEYDLEIAVDEYKIAKLKGMSDEELKAYEDEITIARNNVELRKNNADELYNSFEDSQSRLKGILDDKMDLLSKQSEALKKVEEAKESNPALMGAYRGLRRGIKSNAEVISDLKSGLEEATREFSDDEDIIKVYESVWNIDIDGAKQADIDDGEEHATENQYEAYSTDEFWDSYFEEFFADIEDFDFSGITDSDWDSFFNELFDGAWFEEWLSDDYSDDSSDDSWDEDWSSDDDGDDDWYDSSDVDDWIDDAFDALEDLVDWWFS